MLSRLLQPLRAPIDTARDYSWTKLRRDLLAALTVSVVEVPQAMAYALVAGVPPEYGIYTSIFQGIVGALFSSSEHMATGPTNTQSLLVASIIHRMSPAATPEDYLHLVFALTFLKGLIQLAFAAARMGDMVRYVSRSVLAGLVSGAGVLIFVGQLPHLMGIDVRGTQTPLVGAPGSLHQLIQKIDTLNPQALLVGLGCLLVIVGLRAVWRFLPGSLVAVAGSAAVVAAMGWGAANLPLVGEIPRGLPRPVNPWPGLLEAESLLGGALALALLGMIESVAIAKSIAAKTGERISANQEFFTQGFKNALTSFLQCIPGSGSFSRSALDYEAGAATRFAAVFNALFVAAIFLLFSEQASRIPLASLAAVLLVIAVNLVDWRYLSRVSRVSKADAAVCLATFFATLTLPLEYAVFVGIFLNLGLYLRTAGRLHVAEMIASGRDGAFEERPIRDTSGQQRVIFLAVEGDLFFGVADELRDQLDRLRRGGVRVVILRLRRTHSIDATVLHVLDDFARAMRKQDRHVVLCGVKSELLRQLAAFGLVGVIGADNVFETGHGVFAGAKAALARARHLVGESLDTAGVDEHESDEWAYSI